MSLTILTVHYRRRRRDYLGWRLYVKPEQPTHLLGEDLSAEALPTEKWPCPARVLSTGTAGERSVEMLAQGCGKTRVVEMLKIRSRHGSSRVVRTAFGVVYRMVVGGERVRIMIGPEGEEGEWLIDGCRGGLKEVFVQEGCTDVWPSIDAEGGRYLGVLVLGSSKCRAMELSGRRTSSEELRTWLETRDRRGGRVDVFPGDPPVPQAHEISRGTSNQEKELLDAEFFLLDWYDYKSPTIVFSLHNYILAESPVPIGEPSVVYAPDMGYLVSLSHCGGSLLLTPKLNGPSFSNLLNRSFPYDGFSSIKVLDENKSPRPRKYTQRIAAPHGSLEDLRLVIHYRRYVVDFDNIDLVVSCVSAPAFIASTTYHGVLNRAGVFSVDLTTVPAEGMTDGFNIVSVWKDSGLPLGDEVNYKFDKQLGADLLMWQDDPSLHPLADITATIWYHRYGWFADYAQWRLVVWNASAEDEKVEIGAEQIAPGTAIFDLSPLRFPLGAQIHIQPVKLGTHHTYSEDGSHHLAGPVEGGSASSSSVQIIAADVTRTFASEDLGGDIHCFQGSAKYTHVPRSSQSEKNGSLIETRKSAEQAITQIRALCDRMEDERFIFIDYRRYSDDGASWDLWVWDASDPQSKGHAVSQRTARRRKITPEMKFVIDRGDYGSGTDIRIISRRGGGQWLDKDEPPRIWRPSLHTNELKGTSVAPETSARQNRLYMVEGYWQLLKGLDHARELLVAYADGYRTVSLELPVPVEWLSGFLEVSVNVFDKTVTKLSAEERAQMKGKSLAIQNVKRIGKRQVQITLKDEHDYFDEDFHVENVLVCLSGFTPAPLRWREYADLDKYNYTGQLGWQYEDDRTTFRVFAPTADLVSVVIYQQAKGGPRELYPMRRIPEGCWKVTIHNDLNGRYYKLLAEGRDKRLFPGVEVIDPYSRCNTSHTGRGLIFAKEDTPIAPSPSFPLRELIVYELHVRDISIDRNSGVEERYRGKFLGLAQRGTKVLPSSRQSGAQDLVEWRGQSSDELLSSCLDHIVEMGVTAVQILPVQDFDNDEDNEKEYNWGYMPVHFNSPDGWYICGDKTSVARIAEFKLLVDAIHRAGLKVIMDVVYNHTAEDSNELNVQARFSFNGLVPRYYYRTCANVQQSRSGHNTCIRRRIDEEHCGYCYSNGSGCGNEFRSEAPMGRKFILDSLKYWVNEYKIDGFRFDLAGLMDSETMALLATELPNTVLYGEPWAGGITPIEITGKGKQRSKGFGFFNNIFRDALRGSPFELEECFLMDGGRIDEVKKSIIGSIDTWTDCPQESINYIECHDNRTLYDHFVDYRAKRTDDIDFGEEDVVRMHKLGAAIIFTSQGIPFIQAGQEMMRTKFGNDNSYKSPDHINMMRWSLKYYRLPVVRYYQGLIRLRREHPELFCLESAESIRERLTFYEDLGITVPGRCIAYRIAGNRDAAKARLLAEGYSEEDASEEADKWQQVAVLLNPVPETLRFSLPGGEEDVLWIVVVDARTAGVEPLRGVAVGNIDVSGRSAMVLRMASEREKENARLEMRLAAVTDAYAAVAGDDGLNEYAVGIWPNRTAGEKEIHDDLKLRRELFQGEQTRVSR